MARLHIIDDDELVCVALAGMAKDLGHEASYSLRLAAGLAAVEAGDYSAVFLDVHLPDGNGLEALPRIQRAPSQPEVIIVTALGDADGAELSIKSGAWDYIAKPLSLHSLRLSLDRALRFRETKASSRPMALKRGGVVGESPRILACLDRVAAAAALDVAVLISGETGVGKELFARAIHANSPRAGGPFVAVDCAALTGSLAESALFGHRRGAFTGADSDREGLVALAHLGTLFLDEVGEMPPDLQRVFLRVLQERRFRPVGERRERESDFRLVAASNRDLEAEAKAGRFREDLLYRLRGVSIELPPLRQRTEDLLPLAREFVRQLCAENSLPDKAMSQEFMEMIARYPWPGNVRELRQAMAGAVAASGREPVLLSRRLPTHVRVRLAREALAVPGAGPVPPAGEDWPDFRSMRDAALAQAERDYLVRLAERCGGDWRLAVRLSGLSRSRLYELLGLHGLSLTRRLGRASGGPEIQE